MWNNYKLNWLLERKSFKRWRNSHEEYRWRRDEKCTQRSSNRCWRTRRTYNIRYQNNRLWRLCTYEVCRVNRSHVIESSDVKSCDTNMRRIVKSERINWFTMRKFSTIYCYFTNVKMSISALHEMSRCRLSIISHFDTTRNIKMSIEHNCAFRHYAECQDVDWAYLRYIWLTT